MELCFFRHGIAIDRNDPGVTSDRDRPLTAEGVKKTHAAAEGLARMDVSFDRILTSPWLRALQTARIVGEVLGVSERVEEMEELAGDQSVDDVLRGLTRHAAAARLMIVGHQPLLGDCIARLLTGESSMEVDLKKGGACAIQVERVRPNAKGTLLWLATSKQLRLMR